MSKAYELIVFDWDGTLMNSLDHITYCLRHAFLDMGLEDRPDHELQRVIGLGLEQAMMELVPGQDEEFYEQIVQSYRNHWMGSPPGLSQFYEGIPQLLNQLYSRNIPMAVATGKSRRGLDKQLQEENVGHFFSCTRCADESISKPAPDMLLEILHELSVSASSTLVIGDTEFDMQMARAAGCDRIAVGYGVHTADSLTPYEPVTIANTPKELTQWFEINLFDPNHTLATD